MPVTLWLAAREHHDAILRELVLDMAEHPDVEADLAAVDEARSRVSTVRDATAVSEAATDTVADDDANRVVAVSFPFAELVGWRVEDLVGQRVVTVIPPHLREAHVAGFSRHLTTGRAHALAVHLELPVLRADGSEVLCHFLVAGAPAHGGRAVYVAWIDPLG